MRLLRLVFFLSSPEPVVFAVFVALPALSLEVDAGALEATGALPAVEAGLVGAIGNELVVVVASVWMLVGAADLFKRLDQAPTARC